MNPSWIERRIPGFLRRHILYFETQTEAALAKLALSLPDGAQVLDAGAWETHRTKSFPRQKYVAVDLRVGDRDWDYRGVDAVADMARLPFRDCSFDACVNVMMLQHLRDPAAALAEIERALKPGASLVLVAPHEWEVHHVPRDYFRFTRYGLRHLFERAGFTQVHVYPVGGFFRLLARRLVNALEFFPGLWSFVAGIVLLPAALIVPAFDSLDRERNFTLGYLCTAKKLS